MNLLIAPAHATNTAQQPTPERKGKIVADIGFRPEKDGFSFTNYTNKTNPQNLTAADMYTIFGASVCSQVKAGVCTLTPIAEQQMQKTNDLMNGGHCDGMAALALLIYQNTVKAAQFGGSTTNTIPFGGNELVQREIARWFMKQTVDPLYGQKLHYLNDKITPATVLDTLIKSMTDRSELYVLQVFRQVNRGWEGHAVTPYAIEDLGNGLYHILVYDNNHPNVERFVEVDKNANTWKFTASTNPNAKNAVYEGNAGTGTLMLLPLSLRLQPAKCTFCEDKGTSGAVTPTAAPNATPKYNEILLGTDVDSDNLSIVIKDGQGRRLGFEGDKFYNEIPGAYFVPIASQSGDDGDELWADATEPLYYVPAGIAFSVVIDGTELTEDEEVLASVSVFGENTGVSVDEIDMVRGAVDELKFEADGRTFSYKSNTGVTPEIFVGTNQPEADYGFTLQGSDLADDGEVNVTLDLATRTLQVGAKNITTNALFNLAISRIDENTESEFYAEDIELEPKWIIAADWGKWKGGDDLDILIDTDGDHKFDRTDTRKDEPLPEGAAYVQAAAGGLFTHLKGNEYTLTLAQPAAITSYINSRPPYASAPLDTAKVANQWASGNAKADTDAVLEIDRASIALTLSDPHYDAGAHTLTYLAKLRGVSPVGSGTTTNVPPGAFGAANLVIAENAPVLDALTAGNKKLNDLVAGSRNLPDLNAGGGNNPDLNAGSGNNPDLNAGSGNNPDLNAGTLEGEYPIGYYQTARSGGLVKAGDSYTLTLKTPYPLLQVVSQAPNLGTVWVSSDALHKVWNTYQTTTATALLTASGKRVLLRLSHPVSDPAKGTITYTAQILAGTPLDSFEDADLLITSDSAFSAALTLSLNVLRTSLNAGGGNNPDLNAGSGNNPDLNAGSGNNPDLNAGSGNNPDLNAGGINLVFGGQKTITPEMAKTCQDTLNAITVNLKTLGNKLPDAALTAKLAQLDVQADASCPLSSQVFTPAARRKANGITTIALPPVR
jgi:hypothetical protein